MNKLLNTQVFLFVLLVVSLSSCKTRQQYALYDPKEVAELSRKLGISLSNIDKDDDYNMPLYAEASLWLGVPYRYAGLSRSGLDCSGLTHLIYQKVYNQELPRSTTDMAKMKMKSVSKKNLKAGDLVFFATSENKKKISHVGVFLKDGFFIHSSTSRGVVVDHLDSNYYRRTWKKGGRVR